MLESKGSGNPSRIFEIMLSLDDDWSIVGDLSNDDFPTVVPDEDKVEGDE